MADTKVKNVGKEDNAVKTPSKPSAKELDVIFLTSIGQKISGTVEEVHQRAELFRNQPKLANRLEKDCEAKKRNDRIFGREIRWDEVPSSQERWMVGPFPTFTKDQLFQYASPKLSGRKSMLEKGERFFNSRKVRVQRRSCNYYS